MMIGFNGNYESIFHRGIMKAFFTGHRYIDNGWNRQINQLIDLALQLNVQEFYSGMARGTDLTAAEVLTSRKLKWNAIIPCKNQDELWKISDKNRYAKVLKSASNVKILYPTYSPGVMQARDKWLVNHCDLCLGIYDGREEGGTALTIKMAICRNIRIIVINPMNNKIFLHEPQFHQLSLFEL